MFQGSEGLSCDFAILSSRRRPTTGGLIHVLLALAVISVLARIIMGRRLA
jgi:hypothetical protein